VGLIKDYLILSYLKVIRNALLLIDAMGYGESFKGKEYLMNSPVTC
jgi:hypothetical protein